MEEKVEFPINFSPIYFSIYSAFFFLHSLVILVVIPLRALVCFLVHAVFALSFVHSCILLLILVIIRVYFLLHSLSAISFAYTVSPVIFIRHTEFQMQPTSAGPGTRAHDTHGMPKSAQHFLV
jgi:hypothetical protein